MSSRRIGSYQITDYVGSGGFGSVFKAESIPQQPVASAPSVPTPPQATETVPPPAAGRDACVLVTVLDPDGQPAVGVRVGLADPSEIGRAVGRTGPKGHWQQCGLTPGRSVQVAVWGPRGGMINSQTVVVTAPRTLVTFRAPKRMDDAAPFRPERRPPYRRRP